MNSACLTSQRRPCTKKESDEVKKRESKLQEFSEANGHEFISS